MYEEARPSQRKRHTEDEFLRFCNVMLHDVDRKIQKGKQRLQLMQRDHPSGTMSQAAKQQEHLNNLTARINKLLAEAEEAGIRGDVDQAQDLMALCEELKEEKETLQQQYEAHMKSYHKLRALPPTSITTAATTPTTPTINEAPIGAQLPLVSPVSNVENVAGESIALDSKEPNETADEATAATTAIVSSTSSECASPKASASPSADDNKLESKSDGKQSANWSHEVLPEKQMKVCEICGAFLIVGDAQQRIEDHLMGKQHLGYSKLRNAVAEINERRQKEHEEEERKRRDDRVQRFHNSYENRR